MDDLNVPIESAVTRESVRRKPTGQVLCSRSFCPKCGIEAKWSTPRFWSGPTYDSSGALRGVTQSLDFTCRGCGYIHSDSALDGLTRKPLK